VNGWTARLLRTYTQGEDGFDAADVAAQGVVCDITPEVDFCTVTFADIPAGSTVSPPDFNSVPDANVFKAVVAAVNQDQVLSSPLESNEMDITTGVVSALIPPWPKGAMLAQPGWPGATSLRYLPRCSGLGASAHGSSSPSYHYLRPHSIHTHRDQTKSMSRNP
jgi:hypothetical protein